MNVFDGIIGMAYASCLAFCFVFPRPHAAILAAAIGCCCFAITVVTAMIIDILLKCRKKTWKVPNLSFLGIVLALTGLVGLIFLAVDRKVSWVGIPAFLAALIATCGPARWRRPSFIGFTAIFALAIVLHVSTRW